MDHSWSDLRHRRLVVAAASEGGLRQKPTPAKSSQNCACLQRCQGQPARTLHLRFATPVLTTIGFSYRALRKNPTSPKARLQPIIAPGQQYSFHGQGELNHALRRTIERLSQKT
jgi:hypothetical protein